MLKLSNLIFTILIISTFVSCKKESRKEMINNEVWDNIELITKNQRITIYKFEDTASSEKEFYKKISGEGFSATYKLDKVERKNFKINKSERDSLYKYVFKLFTKPKFTDKSATDYAGYIMIKLKDRNTTLMCEYKSVGEWSSISPETEKIYKLVNAKVELPK